MKNYIIILLIALTLGACSPQKRLHRLVALHPELVQNDTIHIIDTTIIPEVRIDTMIHTDQLRDTVIITKENIRVKIHQVNDTVYIEAERESDTVILHKEIPIEKIVYQKPNRNPNNEVTYFLFGVLVIMVVLFLTSKCFRV
jgi:PBP1b-binding outer membrane lipoprotein LpoB